MNKIPFITTLIISLSLIGCASLKRAYPTIKVLHYNIFELDSTKLTQSGHEQLEAVKELIREKEFNILSVNEIQFDLPQVPTQEYMTYGENLNRLLNFLSPTKSWNTSFFQANTGNLAEKKPDPINFGLFPGQYSTGLATDFKILKRTVITDLPWRDFNPQIKLSRYRDNNGRRLPKNMPLFDKNFVDTLIEVDGRQVHLITLHTVPAYHFGKKRSPNYDRNRDQLRFLEWYLTGKTDIAIELQTHEPPVLPLSLGEHYIAMGDWNTDVTNLKNPGSAVLRRFKQTGRLLPSEGEITQESRGHAPDRLKMSLDYIFYSEGIELVTFEILRPKEERLFIGCGDEHLSQKDSPHREVVKYWDPKEKKDCHLTVSKKFHNAKNASDHFPLYATFNFL